MWCRILNDDGILGRAARDSLTHAAKTYQHWPLASALPHCRSVMGRTAAILMSGNLLPTSAPPIWGGCQISQSLTFATTPVMDERGTLLDPQPYPLTHDILQRLTPLWQHDIYTWEHLVYQPRGGAPAL